MPPLLIDPFWPGHISPRRLFLASSEPLEPVLVVDADSLGSCFDARAAHFGLYLAPSAAFLVAIAPRLAVASPIASPATCRGVPGDFSHPPTPSGEDRPLVIATTCDGTLDPAMTLVPQPFWWPVLERALSYCRAPSFANAVNDETARLLIAGLDGARVCLVDRGWCRVGMTSDGQWAII